MKATLHQRTVMFYWIIQISVSGAFRHLRQRREANFISKLVADKHQQPK